MIKTTFDAQVDIGLANNYFRTLVNRFFKILPIREAEEESLPVYLRSLQVELLGCKELIQGMNNNSSFLTLLSILQYFIDNPDASPKEVRREVFRAISICNKLKAQYSEGGDENECVGSL